MVDFDMKSAQGYCSTQGFMLAYVHDSIVLDISQLGQPSI